MKAKTINQNNYQPITIDLFLVAILMVFGLSISLFYGRVGFMPLDHSIIFDGGWRILSGQIPFRDFTTPTGITPMILQALFFKIFGVNWFAYCLHAAIFNGLFCVLIYTLLRLLNGARHLSFFYALLSGIVMYPPIGIPYMEQHAFFFGMVAIVMAIIATKTQNNLVRIAFWFLIPSVFGLAYLSKQIPTIFIIPLLVLVLFTESKKRLLNTVFLIVGGIVIFHFLMLAIFNIYTLDINKIYFYYFQLPSSAGRERIIEWIFISPDHLLNFPFAYKMYSIFITQIFFSISFSLILRRFQDKETKTHLIIILGILNALPGLMLLSYSLTMLLGIITYGYKGISNPAFYLSVFIFFLLSSCLAFFIAYIPKKLTNKMKWIDTISENCSHHLFQLFFAESLLFICSLFILLTANQVENGMSYIFVSCGIFHITVYNICFAREKKSRLAAIPKRLQKKLAIISLSLLLIAFLDACSFNFRVNATRSVNDFIHKSETPLVISERLPAALQFMVWDTPYGDLYMPENLRDLTVFLRKQPENFFLIGDSSILYGITGKPSTNPALWFHSGLAIPMPNTEAFEDYEDQIIQNINKYNVRFIVLEGQKAWSLIELSNFKKLSVLLQTSSCSSHSFGYFKVVELCSNHFDKVTFEEEKLR